LLLPLIWHTIESRKSSVDCWGRALLEYPASLARTIERDGFKYFCYGTLTLYAALETATGRVHGEATARKPARFFPFLEKVRPPPMTPYVTA
jgi:hypothetical protein